MIARSILMLLLALPVLVLLIPGPVLGVHSQQAKDSPVAGHVEVVAYVQGENAVLALDGVPKGREFHAVLLPVSPDEDGLPGLKPVWQAIAANRANGPFPLDRDGFDALQAWPLDGPSGQRPLFSASLPGDPLGVAIRGAVAYLLCSPERWMLLDLADPRRPLLKDLTPEAHQIVSMAIGSRYAFLLTAQEQILVMDVGNPWAPREVRRIQAPAFARSIMLHDGHLLISIEGSVKRDSFLSRYRIHPDMSLSLDRKIPIPGPRDIYQIHGETLCFLDTRGRLRVVNLAAPVKDWTSREIAIPEMVKDFTIRGNVLYAWSERQGLFLFDLADPGGHVTRHATDGLTKRGIFYHEGHLFVLSSRHGLQVYALDMGLPRGDGPGASRPVAGQLLPVAPGHDLAAVTDQAVQLATGFPPEIERIAVPGIVQQAHWFGDDLLLLMQGGVLGHYSRDNEGQWHMRDLFRLSAETRWLVCGPDQVLLGGDDSVLHLVRTGTGSLAIAQRVRLPVERTYDAVLFGSRLYMAAGRSGLVQADLAARPVRVRLHNLALPRTVRDRADIRSLAVRDEQLMVAAGDAGLVWLTLSHTVAPRVQGVLPLQDPILLAGFAGDYWLAVADSGVHVVELTQGRYLQAVGRIGVAQVSQLKSLDEKRWAVETEKGWVILPAPKRLVRKTSQDGQIEVQTLESPEPGHYRLNLVERDGLMRISGVVTLTQRMTNAQPGGRE